MSLSFLSHLIGPSALLEKLTERSKQLLQQQQYKNAVMF
jgi:hypothetical protein